MRLIDAEQLKHILNNSKYYGTEAGDAFADMITECESVGEKKKTKDLISRKKLISALCKCKLMMIVNDDSNFLYIRQSEVFDTVNKVPTEKGNENEKTI